jgi:hypothetical protein
MSRAPVRQAGAIAVVALLALAGCAAPDDPKPREIVLALAESERAQGHEAQYELMKDGVVDREDYDQAFRLLRQCMEEGGLIVGDPTVSPADGLRYIFEFEPNGLAPTAVDEVQQACEAEFWFSVSTAYTDTNPAVMAEPLRLAAIECLIGEGYDLTGEEKNFPEMVGDPDSDDGTQREAASDCVFDAAHELYPELPYLSLSS